MTSNPTSLGYLRLTQHGSGVIGYFEGVEADYTNSNGYKTTHVACSGSVSGSTILLFVGSTQVDGTWGRGNITLEFPSNGFVSKLKYSTTSVVRWNASLFRFEQIQTLAYQMMAIKRDYDSQYGTYKQVKAVLTTEEPKIAPAQKKLDDFQVALDAATTDYNDAVAALKRQQDDDDKVPGRESAKSQELMQTRSDLYGKMIQAESDRNSAKYDLDMIKGQIQRQFEYGVVAAGNAKRDRDAMSDVTKRLKVWGVKPADQYKL